MVVWWFAQVLKRLMSDFYSRKDCKLGRSFFEEAGRRSARVRAVLLPLAMPHVAAARTDFLVMEAATLLATLLRQAGQSTAPGQLDAQWAARKENVAAVAAAAAAAVSDPPRLRDALLPGAERASRAGVESFAGWR